MTRSHMEATWKTSATCSTCETLALAILIRSAHSLVRLQRNSLREQEHNVNKFLLTELTF